MRWKADKRSQWHRWFAWHPVHIGDQSVWLERVWRKGRQYQSREGGALAWDWVYERWLGPLVEEVYANDMSSEPSPELGNGQPSHN